MTLEILLYGDVEGRRKSVYLELGSVGGAFQMKYWFCWLYDFVVFDVENFVAGCVVKVVVVAVVDVQVCLSVVVPKFLVAVMADLS